MHYLLNSAYWDITDPSSIPSLFIQHIWITFVSMAIGIAIAAPISLALVRYTRFYPTTITVASIIYTLPSLAFMAFLIPFTGLSSATVIIPLVFYTQVVLIRNFVAAIRSVDPTLVEVGRAMGMSSAQLQWRVVLPLAAPIIIAGIRVTTVTTIGIASISQLFGVPNLGSLIIIGFANSYSDQVLAGAIAIAVLAVGADLTLLGVQSWINRGRSTALVAN